MKLKLENLEMALAEIIKVIEQRIEIEQIDLTEFDRLRNDKNITPEEEIRKQMLEFRNTIVKYKADNELWEKEIPGIISLLDKAKIKLQSYKKVNNEIGGNSIPNPDIINLLERNIITILAPIRGKHKGTELIGHLTTDGYLEIELNGTHKKLTLRQAAIYGLGCSPPNQWMFWEALNSGGVYIPLEYFRKLLTQKL